MDLHIAFDHNRPLRAQVERELRDGIRSDACAADRNCLPRGCSPESLDSRAGLWSRPTPS